MKNKETEKIDVKELDIPGWYNAFKIQPDYNVPVMAGEFGVKDSVDIYRLESKLEKKGSVSFVWLENRTGYNTTAYDITHWRTIPTL